MQFFDKINSFDKDKIIHITSLASIILLVVHCILICFDYEYLYYNFVYTVKFGLFSYLDEGAWIVGFIFILVSVIILNLSQRKDIKIKNIPLLDFSFLSFLLFSVFYTCASLIWGRILDSVSVGLILVILVLIVLKVNIKKQLSKVISKLFICFAALELFSIIRCVIEFFECFVKDYNAKYFASQMHYLSMICFEIIEFLLLTAIYIYYLSNDNKIEIVEIIIKSIKGKIKGENIASNTTIQTQKTIKMQLEEVKTRFEKGEISEEEYRNQRIAILKTLN